MRDIELLRQDAGVAKDAGDMPYRVCALRGGFFSKRFTIRRKVAQAARGGRNSRSIVIHPRKRRRRFWIGAGGARSRACDRGALEAARDAGDGGPGC